MPTLYVENVPADVYDALRATAKAHRKSLSAEVLELLAQHVPTKKELARRRSVLARLAKIRSEPPVKTGPFPTAEEMVREDRGR